MTSRAVSAALLGALAITCGGCVYTVEEHDLFYPRRVPLKHWRDQHPKQNVQIRHVAIRTEGALLRGWLFTPPKVRRSMVHFYGNGELVAAKSVAVRLVYLADQLDCEILVMDYRGYGFTAGSPTFENIQADALRTYDFMKERAGGRGVLVFGLSIGTIPAVRVAAERKTAGLILQAPPTSAAEIIPGFARMIPTPIRWFVRVRASRELVKRRPQPVELIRRVTCPVLVIHGLDDRIIPPRFGHRMYTEAGGKRKRLVEVPDAGHNNLSLADEKTISVLKQFVRSCDR